MKKISDLQKLGNYLGYITASIPVSKIADIVDQGELTVNTCLAVINSHNELITAKNNVFDDLSDTGHSLTRAVWKRKNPWLR